MRFASSRSTPIMANFPSLSWYIILKWIGDATTYSFFQKGPPQDNLEGTHAQNYQAEGHLSLVHSFYQRQNHIFSFCKGELSNYWRPSDLRRNMDLNLVVGGVIAPRCWRRGCCKSFCHLQGILLECDQQWWLLRLTTNRRSEIHLSFHNLEI